MGQDEGKKCETRGIVTIVDDHLDGWIWHRWKRF